MKRITSFNLRNVIKIAFGLPVGVSNWLLFKIILPVRLYTLTRQIHMEKFNLRSFVASAKFPSDLRRYA